jgi:hypothetical protein
VKRCGLLIGVLLLGSLAASRAEPARQPNVVTIDGSPCNRFCQFYMARSRGLRRSVDDHAKGSEVSPSPEMRDRLAKMRAARNEMPQTRTAALQSGSSDAQNSREDAVDGRPMSLKEHLATAAAVAEHLTATVSAATELKAMNGDRFDRLSVAATGKRDIAASPADARVALVISRPEIKSISYLTRAYVAIDGERSGSAGSLRAALVAAGAIDVQVDPSKASAIDRLVRGEVPAAVLTFVSVDAARAFPDIDGFKIYRIPLPPPRS